MELTYLLISQFEIDDEKDETTAVSALVEYKYENKEYVFGKVYSLNTPDDREDASDVFDTTVVLNTLKDLEIHNPGVHNYIANPSVDKLTCISIIRHTSGGSDIYSANIVQFKEPLSVELVSKNRVNLHKYIISLYNKEKGNITVIE